MFRSPSFNPSPSRRALGRNLALDLVAAIGVGVSMALVTALLPTIARRGGLEPLGLSALAAAPFVANLLSAFAGRFGPRSSAQLALIRGIGAASLTAGVRRADRARDDRRGLRLLDEPLVRRAVPPPPVGRHVPGPAGRARGRVHRDGPRRGRRASPRSVVASSPTGLVGRPPSRSPEPSGSRVRWRTRVCVRGPRSGRRPSRLADPSARSASGRCSARSRWPRGSTAAASSRPCRCTPSSTSTAWTCACPMWASSGSWPPSRPRSRSRSGVRWRIATAGSGRSAWAAVSGSIGLIGYALAPDVAVLWVMAVGYGAASAADRRRHRLDRQRPDAAGVARRRDGRLERDHRSPRDRGRVPHERAAAARGRGRDVGAAPVRGRRRPSVWCCSRA